MLRAKFLDISILTPYLKTSTLRSADGKCSERRQKKKTKTNPLPRRLR